jgi:hypothetical protein
MHDSPVKGTDAYRYQAKIPARAEKQRTYFNLGRRIVANPLMESCFMPVLFKSGLALALVRNRAFTCCCRRSEVAVAVVVVAAADEDVDEEAEMGGEEEGERAGEEHGEREE